MNSLVESTRSEIGGPAVLKKFTLPKLSWRSLPALVLIGLLILVLAYPIGLLFVKSFVASRPGQATVWTINGWVAAFTDATLPAALGNTFFLALVRVFITSGLAIFFAWVVTRTDTPLKGSIEVMLWLGFFLPLLPMTMGWILLLDPHYGLINKFFMSIFGLAEAPFDIYSYWGIIWCHLAFSTSVRFMLMTPAFSAMDAALEEAGLVCGSNRAGVLMRVTIPVLAPAVLASTALGLIRSLESLEIEMVLGIPAGIYVVPTKIWDFIHWEPPLYDRATALCSVFLIFIVLLIWLHRAFLGGREFTTVSGRSHLVETFSLGRWRWVTCSLCLLFIAVMILLPLATLVMGTFMEFFGHFDVEKPWTARHWIGALTDPVFLRSLKNTIVLGLGAAMFGTLVYALISYLIVRTRVPGRGVIDILSWLPWALPGVLISLALLWAVLGSGGYVKLIYGTVSLLILAIVIKEMPLGTQIIKAAVQQISPELEEASSAAGANWLEYFRRILLPLLKPTMVSVAIIVFISAARDIPTIIFLSTHETRTLSLLMLDYIAEANQEKAAVLGVFLVFLIFGLLLVGRLLGFRRPSLY
ncbi:MAG TPA: iron ABC transporter permease [Candidatus Binatia bacterium]|nr:iron ABC transporter permease [Candidatus Binatia bacterium]